MTNEEFLKSVSFEGEVWKDVPLWDGYYKASSFGRIMSLERCVNGRYSIIRRKPRIMNPTIQRNTGYLIITFSKNNDRGRQYLVHRIIALTFLHNPHNYECIDHIDTDKTNNNVKNLRWCTYHGNMCNEKTLLHLRSTRKIRRRNSYSTQIVAVKDGVCCSKYTSISSVKQYGYDPKSVWLVCNGMRLHHHGYVWMYLEDYQNTLVNQKVKERLPNT